MNDIDKIENPLQDLSDSKEITFEKILNNLLNDDKNLELKTEIYNPKDLASLLIIAKYLKSIKFHKSFTTIKNFIKTYLRYMVSHNRMSRKEVIQALTPIESKIRQNVENGYNFKID